jgi:hypothetical protein
MMSAVATSKAVSGHGLQVYTDLMKNAHLYLEFVDLMGKLPLFYFKKTVAMC